MVKAKLFVLETAAWGRGSRAVWLPDSKIQAHVRDGEWLVTRRDAAPQGTKDVDVPASWAAAIEALMRATEARAKANERVLRIWDMLPPL